MSVELITLEEDMPQMEKRRRVEEEGGGRRAVRMSKEELERLVESKVT